MDLEDNENMAGFWIAFVLALLLMLAALELNKNSLTGFILCLGKYICPLGAFYALFSKVSIVRMRVDTHKCTDCGACARMCPMNVDPAKHPNSPECIRCGECMRACPMKALSFTVTGRGAKAECTAADNKEKENFL